MVVHRKDVKANLQKITRRNKVLERYMKRHTRDDFQIIHYATWDGIPGKLQNTETCMTYAPNPQHLAPSQSDFLCHHPIHYPSIHSLSKHQQLRRRLLWLVSLSVYLHLQWTFGFNKLCVHESTPGPHPFISSLLKVCDRHDRHAKWPQSRISS